MKEGKLNVCGVNVDVSLQDFGVEGFYGRSDAVKGKVWIGPDQPEEQKEITLIHELVHLIWGAFGMDKPSETTEHMINAIAVEFYRLGFRPSKMIVSQPVKKK